MSTQTSESARLPGIALDDTARETARAALLSLLAEAPVHRIAMRDAARRAGVGLATLYKYFGGKEAMVTAVLGPDLERLVDRLGDASRNAVGVKARFKAVLEASFAFARDHEPAARAVLLNLPAGVWGDEESEWTARRRAVLAHIFKNGRHDGSVRSDVEPDELADLVFGAVDQTLERLLRTGRPVDPARLAASVFSTLWPAVSAD
ncbi:MAG: TetR/AcrR family transcriptional regulator [Alphaproteobacteria bacterium]|nr:TetR/AcrR family transcriptional regulator [Alphaproteobacteria bacterium]